ncbi:fasciclin domain-containing protein [Namhaeicola litoreus]|uniref:Fasciclin domain-containing protein n=1 Tax=Namhaeicola litoreus TaxID=1052145 RepID=A0ABW3XZZ1_9FLAO
MKTISNHLKLSGRLFLSVLMVGLLLFTTSCDDDDDKPSKNIVEVAQGNAELSTLVSAVQAAGLTSYLSGTGPFTVFAPTNAAFAKIDPATLNNILGNPTLLTALLQYHVVNGKVYSKDLTDGEVNTALAGQTVLVDVNGNSVTLNGSSMVTDADIKASNGVIHIIDEVLIPDDFAAQTIVQIAASNPNFSTLVQILSLPEMSDLLAAANDPTADLTVFAPTNAAFDATLAALGKNSINDIPTGILKEIVTYHILGGAVFSNELSNGDVPTLLPGESVTVDVSGSGVKIDNANVIAADVAAINGVIHGVDGVLLPSYVTTAVGNIGEVVLFNKDFTVLAAALRKAELLDAVSTTDNITVFAPDNAAFVKAGITSLDGLTKDDLTPVLLYHVLGAKVLSSQLPASGIAKMLNEENIYLGYLTNSVLVNGLSTITAVDIEKDNGVIHVIDRTLVPPAGDIVDIAAALADNGDASQFTVLVSLLSNPAYEDITAAIKAANNITVFAPTDAAFAEIASVIPTLTEDQISAVLTYHATNGRVFSSQLVNNQVIPMLSGQNTIVRITGGAVALQDLSGGRNANVVEVNVHGSNGVIHVIDKVLLPLAL